MKKPVLFASLALLAACAFAQSGTALAPNEGFVVLHNLPLYAEKGTTLEWKENMVIGDRVVVSGRTAKFKVDGAEREYVRVKSQSGLEGWARAPYVVQKSALAVVKADPAVVYSEARDVKITASTISEMTVVAVLQETSGAFAKVLCYDEGQKKYYIDPAVFVAREDLSFADADVNAVILYMTAAAQKAPAIKAALLKSIEKKYSSSIFFDKIRARLDPAAAVSSGGKLVVPSTGSFLVREDKVNVRAQPDEKAGAITAQLSKGARVEVIEATAESYAVGASTAVWYRIKDPSGWVFGGFLDPAR